MEAEAEAVDGKLKEAEAKEKLTAVASLVVGKAIVVGDGVGLAVQSPDSLQAGLELCESCV